MVAVPEAGAPSKASLIVDSLTSGNKEAVLRLGSSQLISDIGYYTSTQCATVDYAISRPGIPSGRLTTIIGKEGSGKSTLLDHVLAENQLRGGISVKVDSEARFDRERALAVGLDVDNLILIQGTTLEQSFDQMFRLMEEVHNYDPNLSLVIGYDSIAGSIPEKRMNGETGDVLPGVVAKFIGDHLPKLHQKAAEYGHTLVFINQIRSRLNIAGPYADASLRERNKVMGQSHSMIAEWPLIFASSLILYVNMIGFVGDKDSPTGIRSRVSVRKCSIGPGEGRRAEMEIDKVHGIDKDVARFELLEMLGMLKSAGGWYSLDPNVYPDEPKFRKADFPKVYEAHPELADIVEAAPILWKQETI